MAFRREATIRKAEKYVARGKIDAAIDEYRKVLKSSPTDVNTLNRVGDLYARLERYDEAVRLFTQIAEQYTREGFFVKAIAIYKKIIKLDPSSLQVYEKLAALYAEQGLVTEARTQYQVLADYYQKHDNAASAITIYQRMADLEPENPSFQLKLAELFASRHLNDKALAAYIRLADIFLVDGSIDEAAKVYLEALEVSASDLDFVERAVRGLFDAGKVPAAARVLARAVELNPAAAAIGNRVGLDQTGSVQAAPPAAAASVREPELDSREVFELTIDDEPLETGIELQGAPPGSAASEREVDAQPFRLDLDFDDLTESGAIDLGELPMDDDDEDDPLDLDLLMAPDAAVPAAGGHTEAAPDASDVFVFEIDLDDDEIPESLVRPPSDMVDKPIGVLGSRDDELDEAPAPDESSSLDDDVWIDDDSALAPAPPGDGSLEGDELADLERLELDALSVEPEDVPAGLGEPIEIDWSQFPEETDDAGGETRAETPEPETAAADELEVFEIGSIEGDEAVEPVVDITPLSIEAEDASAEAVEVAPIAVGLAAVRREEDLLAEAQVFAKYGLREKAEERLRELWNLNADNLEGLALKTRLLLEDGDLEAVMAEANNLARASQRIALPAIWHALRAQLADVGFGIEADRVVAVPGAVAESPGDRITHFLEGLDRAAAAGTPSAGPPAVPQPDVDSEPSDEVLAGEIDSALDSFFGARAGGAAKAGRRDVRSPNAADGGPAADPAATMHVDVLDESGMSWLEEEPAATGDEPGGEQAAPIFDEDDEFFDLAAEIERELEEEDSRSPTAVTAPKEPSLEEIVEGFKRGVAEHLSAEDYDTHFNLGIAYREMGLLDEAIGEFQLASKDARYLVESSSMLGMSFLEKGLPSLAIKWYRKGLAAPELAEVAMLGLLYDMATAFEQDGDEEAAQRTWIEIYGINSHYRDVAERVKPT